MPRLADARWRHFAFAEIELEAVARRSETAQLRLLAATWSLKEAVVKANGTGFSCGISPHGVVIEFRERGPWLSSALAQGCPHNGEFFLSTSWTRETVVGVCVIGSHRNCRNNLHKLRGGRDDD